MNFPLPVPHAERTSATDFIPTVEDPTGRGERMWQVMSRLKLTQGPLAGKRLGDVAPPWQEKWVRTLYGATDAVTGGPLYDEAFLYVAKKNGKTSLIGMLAVAHSLAFPESRGLTVVLAATKEQAGLCYDSMAATIEADSYLQTQFQVRRYRADIVHTDTGSTLKSLASEMNATTGTQPNFYIVDEVHLVGERQQGASMVRQLSSGAAIREQSLGVYISTAPVGTSQGIFKSLYDRGLRILSGETTGDRLMPTYFELPPKADPEDSSLWWMSNPSLGYTFTEDWLKREYDIAKADPDPSNIANFYSQHLNIHAQEVMGVDRWIPLSVWDACADSSITRESLLSWADSIWVGVDAGVREDLTAITLLGQADGEDEHRLWSHQWLHRDGYDRRKTQAPYDDFIAAGELTICDRDGQDLAEVYAMIEELWDSGKLLSVGVDQHKLVDMIRAMEEMGIDVLAVPQGWQMTKYILKTDRMIYEGKLKHFGGPLLRFNFENAQLQERGRGYALTKPGDVGTSKHKIDGAVTVVMAVAASTEQALSGLYGSASGCEAALI